MEQKVIDFGEARAKRTRTEKPEPFPSPLPIDMTLRTLKLAAKDGYSFNEVLFAARSVEYWATAGNGRGQAVRKLDWPMTVVNGMRLGWALRNYDRWRRRQRSRPWMDLPLRQLVFDDLARCLEERRRGRYGFVPRTRCETIRDPRLT